MKKNNVINFNKFMDGSFKEESSKIVVHFKKNKKIYIKAGLITTSICLSAFHPTLAAGFGADAIDSEGYRVYKIFLSIGKWVIVVKGGWDVIRATLGNDYDKAKKNFISYLCAYVFLLVLPNAMNFADGIVNHINQSVKAGGN